MKRLLILIVLIFSPVFAKTDQPLEVWTLSFTNLKNEEVVLYAEVARTEEQKRKGLMFREEIGKNEGMIFLYHQPVLLNFWMRNTSIALSIAFVDENEIVQEIYNMKPFDETIIRSTAKSKYAVETNNGWYRKNLIYHGSKMTITKSDLRKAKDKN